MLEEALADMVGDTLQDAFEGAGKVISARIRASEENKVYLYS